MTADELLYEAGLLYNGLAPRHRPAARKALDQIEAEMGALTERCRDAIGWMEARQADHDEVER